MYRRVEPFKRVMFYTATFRFSSFVLWVDRKVRSHASNWFCWAKARAHAPLHASGRSWCSGLCLIDTYVTQTCQLSVTCCCYSDTVKIQSFTCVSVHVCCSRVTRRLSMCWSSSFSKMYQSNSGQQFREVLWHFTPFQGNSFVFRFQCCVTVVRSPLRRTTQRSAVRPFL